MFGFFKKSGPPDIRPLNAGQARACAALHAPAFAHPWSASEFESLLAAGNVVADGAFLGRGTSPVGFCLSRWAADEAEILTIAVDGASRRQGIGRALLATHLARLAALGVKELFLEVGSENQPALKLYTAFGFAKVGERPAYYRMKDGSAANALILRRTLS
jgi:ribosomal-protein-alanine N-acetyltransferase